MEVVTSEQGRIIEVELADRMRKSTEADRRLARRHHAMGITGQYGQEFYVESRLVGGWQVGMRRRDRSDVLRRSSPRSQCLSQASAERGRRSQGYSSGRSQVNCCWSLVECTQSGRGRGTDIGKGELALVGRGMDSLLRARRAASLVTVVLLLAL